MINKKQIAQTFLDLVAIDSPSGHERKVGQYIAGYLKGIGIKARFDKGKNVLAHIPGTGDPLFLCAHMDTVEPGRGVKPMVNGDIIKSDGTTVLGGDCKAGVAEILEALKILKQKNLKHRPLDLIFTAREETDFYGSENLEYKKLVAKEGIVIDSATPPGGIVLSAPFGYIFDVEVRGRAAHSGSFANKGISAIQVASQAIAEIRLGAVSKTTVSNIGLISGGTIRNGVPENVAIKGEVRSFKKENALAQLDIINKAFKAAVRKNKAKLVFKSKQDGRGYSHLKSEKMVKRIAGINKALKIKTEYLKVGTISDANVFMAKGLKAVVISRGGKDVHSAKESIRISEMATMVEFLVEFCQD